MATAERNAEQTERKQTSRPEAQTPDFKAHELQTSKVPGKEAPDVKSSPGEKASLSDPRTESLYRKPEAGDKAAAKPNAGAKSENAFPETEHTFKKNENLEDIARQKLGRNATEGEVKNYAVATALANKLDAGGEPKEGTKIVLPGREKNGDLTYHNPENKNDQVTVHKDGSSDMKNSKDGTSYHQRLLDKDSTSYIRENKGPRPSDNYTEAHFQKGNYTYRETKDASGNIHDVGSDGQIRDKDPEGNSKTTFGAGSPARDQIFDAKAQKLTVHGRDGSTTEIEKNGKTTITDKDGTVSVDDPDKGTKTVTKKDAQGREITTKKTTHKDGGYDIEGKGPNPSDNFDETYSAKTGQTIRVEGAGTPQEKSTTRLPDGTTIVEQASGDNYKRDPDGAEHHWGNKTFDKPPTDYKNDAGINQSRGDLDKAVQDHVPVDKQAAFKKDMADFEARAQKDHLPPDEISKTYEQMSKLLNAKDSESKIPADNRAKLAEQMMYQTAHPDKTTQGTYNTCNVTTVAKETLTKNPSKMAEVATSVALNGKFTAPDGKEIKVDQESLAPGGEERASKPKDGDRSYATQILNLAMNNDALQRRDPPESYGQRKPIRTLPGDNGERMFDASGKIENATMPRADERGNIKYIDGPLNAQNLSEQEIKNLSKSFNGDSSHLLDPIEPGSGVESPQSAEEFGQKLKQYKDQGAFPISLSVDANHAPIQDEDRESPGFGGHVVNVTDYDEVNKTVTISNNWDSGHNRTVKLDDLFDNSRGLYASEANGTDPTFPDELKKEK